MNTVEGDKCPWCSLIVATAEMEVHIKAHEERHIRRLADSHCQNKHPNLYDELICIGPNEGGFGPPCDGCLDEARKRYYDKKATAHGRELSPEEADAVRCRLGFN